MNIAKKMHKSIILIGHVTKDGSIAGPRLLEHIVDVVLQFGLLSLMRQGAIQAVTVQAGDEENIH